MTHTINVVILDTGCANLLSVQYAIQRLGYTPVVSREPAVVLTADKLLLPGVGTAKAAMQQLADRQLVKLIKSCTQPVLGICLGMQLLATSSEEGNVETLGLIHQSIQRLNDHGLPLPHMGWNTLSVNHDHPLFRHIDRQSYFYFVHSFAMPLCSATIAEGFYGERFTAAVQQDNFYGVQFHPEKSGHAGAQLLKNFLEL